jgi:hypothetical protein
MARKSTFVAAWIGRDEEIPYMGTVNGKGTRGKAVV